MSKHTVKEMARKSTAPSAARAEWLATKLEQRSFLVQVLHWFHFRPARLERSWVSEEVLTWELLRTLELLPQSVFLTPLLQVVSRPVAGGSARRITIACGGTDKSISVPIPSNGGTKEELPFGHWLRLATRSYGMAGGQDGFFQCKHFSSAIGPAAKGAVLPVSYGSYRLNHIASRSRCSARSAQSELGKRSTALRTAIEKLSATGLIDDIRYGYERLAIELANRIESHPNRIAQRGN